MRTDQGGPDKDTFGFFVQWHLTERCNLTCAHCYQEGKSIKEMTLPETRNTVRNISDTIRQWSDTYEIPFATTFNVTGGEPLLRKDLPGILREIYSRNFNIYILTNGTLIDKESARMLADIPVSGVQVSIEGPEPIHEVIRGQRSFSSAVAGVGYLLDSGIPVTLNITLSEINAGYLADMVSLATGLGVRRLGFSRLVPYGRGFTLLPGMLSKERLRQIYEEMFSITTPGLEIVTGDPVASQLNQKADGDDVDAFPTGGCAAGVSGITLLPDGTITPCRRLPIPIGNVLKDPLREVWATSVVLNALRHKGAYSGKCRTCNRWSNCRGCRAIAYACSLAEGKGDFLAEDPQCFIE